MTAHSPDARILVADIGGTNTRVALAHGRQLIPDSIRRYRNASFAGLEAVLKTYVDDQGGVDLAGACMAMAGPVHHGRATMTNLDWAIDCETLRRATGTEKVTILNDLQAQGYALGQLPEGSVRRLVDGPPAPASATRLVIGVGTGFNAAAVLEIGPRRIVTPSEAGHANLPVRSEAELRLGRFVETVHGFPTVEDVLSGRGLERVHAWLCAEKGVPAEMTAAAIATALATGDSPLATEAARIFVRMLGTVAGNLALIHLPFGGVYFVGGVARAFARHMRQLGFAEAFRDKGRFAGFMANFPVSVIEDDYAALTGAAIYLAASVQPQPSDVFRTSP